MTRLFSRSALKGLQRFGDLERFGVTAAEVDAEVEVARAEALAASPLVPDPRTLSIKGRDCIHYPQLWVQLIHRTLTVYVKARFRVRPLSRDAIVQGVLESLTDSTPFWVVRRDIKSFYESVSTTTLGPRLLNDTALPSSVRRHIALLLDRHSILGNGLPRGVGLAATLAELAMEDFDKTVRNLPGVYRYFRFSDDILLFSLRDPTQIIQALDTHVSARGMKFNKKKSRMVDASNVAKKQTSVTRHFEYLGYSFSFTDHCEDKRPRVVTVSIAPEKVEKIKTRIARAAHAFCNDRNISLLTDRMKYLSSNFRIGPRQRGAGRIFEMRSGIYYNYRMCGVYGLGEPKPHDATEVQDLDNFYHALVNGKFSPLRHQLGKTASRAQIAALNDLSFTAGFSQRLMVNFSKRRMQDIQKAWKYAR